MHSSKRQQRNWPSARAYASDLGFGLFAVFAGGLITIAAVAEYLATYSR